MTGIKLTRKEWISSILLGAVLSTFSLMVLNSLIQRLIFVTVLILGLAIMVAIPIFRVSYTAVYSSGKDRETVKKEMFSENQITKELNKRRGFKLIEESEDAVRWEIRPSILHKLLNRKTKVSLENEKTSDTGIIQQEKVNGSEESKVEAEVHEKDGKVSIEEKGSLHGRQSTFKVAGLYMQKRLLEEALDEHGYNLESFSVDVGLKKEK